MHLIIKQVALRCIHFGIIEECDLDWFIYGLEKRVASFFTGTIFLLIAASLSNVWTAISFLGSFFFLRARTSGYHAKSFIGCVFISLFLELLFILCLLPHLDMALASALNAISFGVVFLFAPYNHPNMHLSKDEILACRTGARIREGVLFISAILFFSAGARDVSNGIVMGNTMAALLLAIAKNKGDVENEHRKSKPPQTTQDSGKGNH